MNGDGWATPGLYPWPKPGDRLTLDMPERESWLRRLGRLLRIVRVPVKSTRVEFVVSESDMFGKFVAVNESDQSTTPQ